MGKIHEEMDEMMTFDNAKVVRINQYDCELYIVTYTIGADDCVTLFEVYSEDDFSRVNINSRRSLRELNNLLSAIVK